ncbi:MAG TPA: hypothetical protein VGH19_11450 [Verrucomicrobiae bacterium]
MTQFDALQDLRRSVLRELEQMWVEKPEDFWRMVKASPTNPYEDKSDCVGWLLTRFVTGKNFPSTVDRDTITATVRDLAGNLKSFCSRREGLCEEFRVIIQSNAKLWREDLPKLAAELQLTHIPPAPPEPDAASLTAADVASYNDWVGQSRVWCNLILLQKHKLSREDACLPRSIKGYPGFVGSQRYAEIVPLTTAIQSFWKAGQNIMTAQLTTFPSVSDSVWLSILDRFSPPIETSSITPLKTLTLRLHTLARLHPDWSPQAIVAEVFRGVACSVAKLLRHLESRKYSDRQAVIKLLNLVNNSVKLALEPLRLSGDYVSFFRADVPRRQGFGAVRGALHEAGDENAILPVLGFSLMDNGTVRYRAALGMRREGGHDEWAFILSHPRGKPIVLAEAHKSVRGRVITGWTGFATTGGSRKKALFRPKALVRKPVWSDVDHPPLVLPLEFGKRQGREYLWHFDRSLKNTDYWTFTNARLIRILPSGSRSRAEYFLTVTMQRETPPVAQPLPDKLIGVDRGEATPAAYALLTRQGKVLAAGKIAEEYREQQRRFDEQKRVLQSTKGGYHRSLKTKERNRALSLSGEVTRHLLHLASEHCAPLVLERLGSGLATRGGSGTRMSHMQYERILTSIEQKLAEAGCYEMPGSAKFRKNQNHFLWLVGPAYTSSTCSACGHVHSREFYETLAHSLSRDSEGYWCVTLPEAGGTRRLPVDYAYYVRGQGLKTRAVDDRLAELLKGREVKSLPAAQFKMLANLLMKAWLPFRPKQAVFICLACGTQADADVQGAINIARKSLFALEYPKLPDEADDARRKKMAGLWSSWYRQRTLAGWGD